MQIICEFCGISVNIKEDDCCPNCGASYADNKEYQAKKKLEFEKEQLKNKKEKEAFERKQRNSKLKAKKRTATKNSKNMDDYNFFNCFHTSIFIRICYWHG